MKDIPTRLRALHFLKVIYLIAMIASIGYLLTLSVLLGIDRNVEWTVGGVIALETLLSIFTGARVLVIVFSAVTLVLTWRVNKECRLALIFGIGAALLAIVSGVLLVTRVDRTISSAFNLVANLATVATLFALLDGIFEKKERGTPLFHFVLFGLVLYAIWAVLDFLVVALPFVETTSYVLYFTSEVFAALSDIIIFLALRETLKEIDAYQRVESEAI